MKSAMGFLIVVLFLSASNTIAAEPYRSQYYNEHTKLSSNDFRTVERAMTKLKEMRPSWKEYEISVVETETTFIVTFWQPEAASSLDFVEPGAGGTPEKIIGSKLILHGALGVELDKKTLKIIGTSNTR